jgi:hypothetical protein
MVARLTHSAASGTMVWMFEPSFKLAASLQAGVAD